LSQGSSTARKEFKVEQRIKIGCIGVGSRLCSLLRILLWEHSDLVDIVAIADESPEALQQAKKEYVA